LNGLQQRTGHDSITQCPGGNLMIAIPRFCTVGRWGWGATETIDA
jgi:hypothetical protein